MQIIDAHHHLWDLRVRDQDWITGPALAPLRRNFLLGDYRPGEAAWPRASWCRPSPCRGRPPNCSPWPPPAT